MTRRSEVKQLEIQREFCETMQNLRLIWDEIGISDEGIESRAATVLYHIRSCLKEMVEEEKNLRSRLQAEVQQSQSEVAELCDELQQPQFVLPPGLDTIRLKRNSYRTQLSELKKVKNERLMSLASLQSTEQRLCDLLCVTPYYIPTGTVPSGTQLQELENHIETLTTEEKKRLAVVGKNKQLIIDLYQELDISPDTSLANDLLSEDPCSFSLSQSKLDEIEELRYQLAELKAATIKRKKALLGKIETLWSRLAVDNAHQDEIRRASPGITPADIRNLETELERVEELKRANLKTLTEATRSDIADLWDKCYYSQEQRQEFGSAFDETYTEDLLTIHENELERMQEYYTNHKSMFANVEKWNKMFRRMLELEVKANDPNRFSNRGGNLLQEEKERKKLTRQLPKVEQELFVTIERWEEAEGKPFLVEGTRFCDYISSQWEAFEQKKENEKQMRQAKKKQETKIEMTFGSSPKAPTKRRFIGTSNLANSQKTPNSKRNKRDQTWRSPTSSQRSETSQ